MDIVFNFFKSNMDVVFFIYGMSFLAMGFAILVYPVRQSKFGVIKILWLLAGFGIMHGAGEFLDMWTLIKGSNGAIAVLKWLCLTVSFIFLFEFGRRLFGLSNPPDAQNTGQNGGRGGGLWRRRNLNWISGSIGWQAMTMAVSIMFILSIGERDFLNSSGIWVRYLLGFSGSMLAGVGFLQYYRRHEETFKNLRVEEFFVMAGAAFMAYGVLSGLFVPNKGGGGVFKISGWLNADSFFNVMHIPVQVFRALCAVVISFSTIKLLDIFDVENAQQTNHYISDLKTANERVDEAYKIARLGRWELDVTRGALNWSENACRILGLDPKGGNSTFKAFANTIHPSDRELVMNSLNDLIKNKQPFDVEHRVELADGQTGYVHQRAMLYNGGGSAAHVTGTVQDITRRKQMEYAVLEKERKLRVLIESTTDAIVTVDSIGVITMWNGAAENIFGCGRDEAVGLPITRFIPERFREAHRAGMKRMLEGGRKKIIGSTTEVFGLRKDGSEVPLEMSLSMHGVGQDVFFNGILRDITVRKKIEEAITSNFETLRKNLHATISAMSMVVEVKDPYTAGHQRRVADLARTIGMEMGLGNDSIEALRMAGSLHDIGKIAIPSEILMRGRKLDEFEYALVKRHPQVGYDMLKTIPFPMPIADIVLQHHEKIDGSGYPSGLKGDDILIEAKVICVADTVEAMISHRPHRTARSLDVALDEISRNSGILYDPDAVDACLRLFNEKKYAFRQ
jgi:PAS domain S-box-containing protein